MTESIAALLRRRERLVHRLAPLVPLIVRGSLLERFVRCGKPGCHCAKGPGHGPKYYLSVSYPGGRPEQQYVSQEQQPQVQALLENFQQVRALLEEVCELNRELLRRQEPF